MIDSVGKTGPGRIDLNRTALEGSAPIARTDDAVTQSKSGAVQSAVAELASGDAPVDAGKVAAIRAAIAEGRYPVDPDAIAERMIALDLPQA